jgi:hypothetical protein
MNLDCISLALGRQEERLKLVRATDAIRLCREGGHRELSWQQAILYIEDLRQQDLLWAREFASRSQLTSTPLTTLDDLQLLALFRQAIRRRDLVAIHECTEEHEGKADSVLEQRRLIRDIELRTNRRLSYLGRHYKLVADVDLGRTPDRERHEVVRHDDAVAVLAGLAEQAARAQPDLPGLLSGAQARLTHDWRPPSEPEGLILLRRILATASATSNDEPTITPSQLKLLRPADIIEIELVDKEGKPVGNEMWECVLPDGSKRSGQLDAEGHALVTDLPPGQCQVTFPKLDADSWSYSG